MKQEFLHQRRSHGLRILFLLSGLLLPGLFPPLWFYFGQPSLLGDWQKQGWDFFIPPTFPLLLTYDWEHRPPKQIQAVSYKSPLLSKLAFQSLSCAKIGSHSFMRQIRKLFTPYLYHIKFENLPMYNNSLASWDPIRFKQFLVGSRCICICCGH